MLVNEKRLKGNFADCVFSLKKKKASESNV